MKTAYDIIRRPVITEQSMADTEMKKYVFEVAKSATKIEHLMYQHRSYGAAFYVHSFRLYMDYSSTWSLFLSVLFRNREYNMAFS